MIIWIVASGDDYQRDVVAVFTEEEVARLYKEAFEYDFLYSMEADPLADKLRAGHSNYGMHIGRDGKVESVWKNYGPKEGCYLVGPGKNETIKTLLVCTMARDERHALEIGQEKWVEMVASGGW